MQEAQATPETQGALDLQPIHKPKRELRPKAIPESSAIVEKPA
jgi:hypothetical protein